MKRQIIVDADALSRERRKAVVAHIIGIVGYMAFFALGVYVGANWPQIAGRIGI